MKYRVEGREKLLSFGQYPDVPLRSTSERRDEARRLIAACVDPSAKRKAERAATSDTFEAIAREYLRFCDSEPAACWAYSQEFTHEHAQLPSYLHSEE
jgi:hypothetical protein